MPTMTEQYMEMNGANRFLAEHCQKTLEENQQELRGISHSVNRCNAEYADCWKAVGELRKMAESQAKELSEANAAIGKLQERLLKAGELYSELKGQLQTQGDE